MMEENQTYNYDSNKKKHEKNELIKNSYYSSSRYNKSHYRKLLQIIIILTSIVSITPLIILAFINFYQYQVAYNADIIYPITKQSRRKNFGIEIVSRRKFF